MRSLAESSRPCSTPNRDALDAERYVKRSCAPFKIFLSSHEPEAVGRGLRNPRKMIRERHRSAS